MAKIVLDIPDAQVSRVINAICQVNGYKQNLGQTKDEYVKEVLSVYIKSCVKSVEGRMGQQAINDSVESEVVIS